MNHDLIMTTPVAVYDNPGDAFARYTVVMQDVENWECSAGAKPVLVVNDDPDGPRGNSVFGEGLEGAHLGKRIAFAELPDCVRRHVVQRIVQAELEAEVCR